MELLECSARDIRDNPFSMIGDGWMLITAGDKSRFNTMTASWGGVGVLWGGDVVFIFVRPTRYTYEFLERQEYFSLSFLPEEQREALNYCGKNSGRDVDKVSGAGLTPDFTEQAPFFAEADTVIVCQKLYHADISPEGFYDMGIEKWYNNDYHRMYVGRIVKVLKKTCEDSSGKENA